MFDAVEDPYLRERKGDSRDVVGPPADEPPARRRGPGRPASGTCDAPCVLVADELHPVGRGAARLDADSGVRHRRRQPDVSHRDSRALAAGARRRRAARRHRRIAPGTLMVVDGTEGGVAGRSAGSRAGRDAGGRAPAREERPRATPAARPSRPTACEIRLEANVDLLGDVASARDAGRRGDRALSIGAPAGGPSRGRADRGGAVRGVRPAARRMSPAPVTVRTFDIDEDQLAARRGTARDAAWTEPVRAPPAGWGCGRSA